MFNFGANDDEKFAIQDTAGVVWAHIHAGVAAGKSYAELIEPAQKLGKERMHHIRAKQTAARLERLRLRKAVCQRAGDQCDAHVLGCLPAEHWVRLGLYALVHHWAFELAIVFAILINCFCLALEAPSLDPEGELAKLLKQSDVIFAFLFLAEAIMKVGATGFYQIRGAYLTDVWNRLDFVIVIVSLVNLVPTWSNPLLKAMRALRPMRLVVRSNKVKVVVLALAAAMPPIFNVALLAMRFWLVFAIMGVNLFKGKMRICTIPGITNLPKCTQYGGAWVNQSPFHFDNTVSAMSTVFSIATMDSWTSLMMQLVDFVSPEEDPVTDYNPGVAMYFVVRRPRRLPATPSTRPRSPLPWTARLTHALAHAHSSAHALPHPPRCCAMQVVVIVCGFFILNLFVGLCADCAWGALAALAALGAAHRMPPATAALPCAPALPHPLTPALAHPTLPLQAS